MRILMLVPQLFYSARGTPLSAYHRAMDLRALGHDVEVLTYGVGDPAPDGTLVVHRARGPHFATSVVQGPSYTKVWFDLLLLASLVERLWRGRYDCLYAHEEGGFLGALLTRLFRVPLVYDMHSSLPLQIRDWGFSASERVVALFRAVERFTLRRAVAAVSIAPAVTEAALAAWPAVRVVTILNRFEIEAPAEGARDRVRRELGVADDERLVLYAGSFVSLQRLDLLIDVVPRVLRDVPEARFVLVGGVGAEIDALGAQVTRLGVTERVRLVAQRPQSEVAGLLAAADVLVSPREQGINPPGKLFSYLASGRPVVAVDRPIHTQILDAASAILVEPTPEALAAGLVAAMRDPARVARTTVAAAALLRERYAPARRREAYDTLLRLIEDARGMRDGIGRTPSKRGAA